MCGASVVDALWRVCVCGVRLCVSVRLCACVVLVCVWCVYVIV